MDYTEILGLVAAVVTTSCFIPQVYKISKEKSTKDISLAMYITMSIGLSLWFIYGISIKSTPVSLANGITLVLVLWIIILKLKYK